jgi:hypothetical protein
MINYPLQTDFVKSCLLKYESTSIPSGEWWEDAHYPIPRCKGGTATVKLWRSDHAIQGLLQSEEYDHPCIWGDELQWLPSDYHELFKKWYRRSKQNAQAALPVEVLRRGALAMREAMTEEEFKRQREQATETLLQNNSDHFSVMGKKARDMEPYEVKAQRAKSIPDEARRRACAKTNAKRYRCLITGKISTPGPLTRYQKARNIDPSLRELVTDL